MIKFTARLYGRFTILCDELSGTFGPTDPPDQVQHLRQKVQDLFHDLEVPSADLNYTCS